MVRQKSVQQIWREAHPKSEAQIADEQSRSEGYWIDPMARPRNEDEEGEAPLSVAEQLGAQAERMRAEGGRIDEWSDRPQSASATALAGQVFTRNRQPTTDEPAPPEPQGKTVDELLALYEEADAIFDQRELFGGTASMSYNDWRTHWGRR